MSTWKPDTCDCVMEFAKPGNIKADFIRFITQCKEHTGGTYDDVILHNQTINLKHGRNPTEAQIEEIKNDKLVERSRIRRL